MLGKIKRLIVRISLKLMDAIEYKYYSVFSDNGFYKKEIQGSLMYLKTDDPGINIIKKSAETKISVLTRAELLIHLCYEIPCK